MDILLFTIAIVFLVAGLAVFLVSQREWVKSLFHAQTHYLEQFSRDLTNLAQMGHLNKVIGRKEEIRRVMRILSRREKDNVILIGKAGVGKTAIVEGLAQAIVDKRVPHVLYGKRVLALDLALLLSGTKYRGEFERRISHIIDEIRAAKRNIILFIDEIHQLSEAGRAQGAMSAGDIFKPPLARGELQVVGATTPLEYEKYVRQDPTLERRLQPLFIEEPTQEQTIEILKGIRDRFEKHHGVRITDEAVAAAVEYSTDYLPGRNFPDKAIDLLDETASEVVLKHMASNGSPLLVDRADIEAVAKEKPSIPV